MNGTTKSLVANHLAESAAGAMTIRAFDKANQSLQRILTLLTQMLVPFFTVFQQTSG